MTSSCPNVFNGYRLARGTDLVSLAGRLRDMAAPIRDALELQEISHLAASILDRADLSGEPRPASVVFDAISAQTGHVASILTGEHECPTVTLGLAVTDDPVTGELLALALHGRGEYAVALDESGDFEYFGYWDEASTGHPAPDDVTAEEWAERGSMWERALRGSEPQCPDSMFRIELGSPLPGMDLVNRSAEILARIPELEVRVGAAAARLVENQSFTSPMEAMAFMSSMGPSITTIENSLKPITLEDLAGGNQ